MAEEIKLKQERRAAKLIRLETEPDVQVYLTELEVDEGVVEVVLHVFDETLQNFIAKRILLSINVVEAPPEPPAEASPEPPAEEPLA
ncbi:MAG: hypothetical protein M3348_16380 [Acidobacteriota bacterium]|nr:hypothetical protein [Acidobacteriota bacterium]